MESQKQIQIKAKNDDLKGVYSNLTLVSHTREEFCLDFVNSFNPPVLVARVLMSPAHLKRFIKALQDNLQKYEDRFGTIEEGESSNPNSSIGFQL